jgi:hypothetical protein
MGMKEELVRTDEENERHRQQVNLNRKRRNIWKQQLLEIKQLSIPQVCILSGCDAFILHLTNKTRFFNRNQSDQQTLLSIIDLPYYLE